MVTLARVTEPHSTPAGSSFAWASLDELRSRTSTKWQAHPPDVLPLWVAEMDTRLAPEVAEALHAVIDRGDTGYPYGTEYAEALGDFAAQSWGWEGCLVDRTAIVPDVMLGIVEALRLVTSPGDSVVVCAPVYPPFYAFVAHDHRRVLEAPLADSGRMDLAALDEAFRRAAAASRTPAFLMSNPHNPTGAVHTRSELEAVAELARRHGVRVVSDEIHAPLVLPGATFTPYLDVAGAENGFALMSASKAWNLAGLKAALLVAGPEAIDDLRRLPEEVSHGPSHVGIIAHTAAFARGGPWLDRLLSALDANRSLLGRLLDEHLPMVGYQAPDGTYLAWLDCRSLGVHDPDDQGSGGIVSEISGPARFFLDEARVALSSGHVFGNGGAGFVRLNFATSPEILGEAVARMGRAVRAAG